MVQNGANSAAGQSVIQLAAAWGVNTINVVRDRCGNMSKFLSIDWVRTQEHIRSLW